MTQLYAIKCSGLDCGAVFVIREPLHKNATYTCKEHTGKGESKAALQRHVNDNQLSRAQDPIAYLRERDTEERE